MHRRPWNPPVEGRALIRRRLLRRPEQKYILLGWQERQMENVSVGKQERMESRILFSEKKRVIPERQSSRSTRQARTVSYFLVEPIGSGRWNMWIRCWSIFRQKIF